MRYILVSNETRSHKKCAYVLKLLCDVQAELGGVNFIYFDLLVETQLITTCLNIFLLRKYNFHIRDKVDENNP